MKLDFSKYKSADFWKKFTIMIIAIFFMGFFLSFLLDVSWGTDPCTFQNKIISDRLRTAFGSFWTFGTFQFLLNIVILIFVIFSNPKLIGWGTIANMTLIGYTSDFFRWIWSKCIPIYIYTEVSYLWLKIIIFVLAIFGFIVAASFYMNADMGLSPYDAIPKIISNHLPKISYSIVRICFDTTVILIGLAASIGITGQYLVSMIGSVIMAFTLGPTITFVGKIMKKLFFRESTPGNTEKGTEKIS